MIIKILIFILKNAIFFSCIFWILTFIFKYFYTNKNYSYKLNFYECGFKSLTNIKVKYNINFMLIILFIIIYDGEFLLLIPYCLNINIISLTSNILIWWFLLLLLITLLFDSIYGAVEWQI